MFPMNPIVFLSFNPLTLLDNDCLKYMYSYGYMYDWQNLTYPLSILVLQKKLFIPIFVRLVFKKKVELEQIIVPYVM